MIEKMVRLATVARLEVAAEAFLDDVAFAISGVFKPEIFPPLA